MRIEKGLLQKTVLPSANQWCKYFSRFSDYVDGVDKISFITSSMSAGRSEIRQKLNLVSVLYVELKRTGNCRARKLRKLAVDACIDVANFSTKNSAKPLYTELRDGKNDGSSVWWNTSPMAAHVDEDQLLQLRSSSRCSNAGDSCRGNKNFRPLCVSNFWRLSYKGGRLSCWALSRILVHALPWTPTPQTWAREASKGRTCPPPRKGQKLVY